eukprot:3668960-Prymnesium_polylepis.1
MGLVLYLLLCAQPPPGFQVHGTASTNATDQPPDVSGLPQGMLHAAPVGWPCPLFFKIGIKIL